MGLGAGDEMKNRVLVGVIVVLVLALAGVTFALIHKNHDSSAAAADKASSTQSAPSPSAAAAQTTPTTTTPQQGVAGSTGDSQYAAGPSSYQLQQAYEQGQNRGQYPPADFDQTAIRQWCEAGSYGYQDPQLQAQYLDGCVAAAG